MTVYNDDDEAAGIWAKDIGLAPRAHRAAAARTRTSGPPAPRAKAPTASAARAAKSTTIPRAARAVEIWNLVFTQFNRVGDPPDNLRPLPSKNIDTGMGLERTAATLQGVPTNYHIDILLPIVLAAAEVCGTKYEYESDNGRRLRRITDHVRACTFAVHENVYPGANKEKYVVKRLLRRAVLDGHQMGLREPFLYKLVPMVAEMMKRPYPELAGDGQARERRDREGRSQLLRHDRRRAQPHRPGVRRDAARQPRDGRRGRGGRAVSNLRRAARAVRVARRRAQPGVRLARLRRRRWRSTAKSRARCSTR